MTASASLLPVAGRVAWWGTAWLRGLVGPDDLIDAALAGDATHVVATADGPSGLVPALAAARKAGADGVGAAFPVSGDPVALRGPREFTTAAVDAGEAVVLLGADLGWVPRQVGRAVEWDVFAVDRRPPPDLGEADRALRGAVLATADALARLDVARWRPEVADALIDLRHGAPLPAPSGIPARCLDLAGRAVHLAAVVDLALADDGAAVSATEIAARRDALLPLERATRHALTAACSPDGWPPG